MSTEPDISGTELIMEGALPILVRRPQTDNLSGPHPALLIMHGFGAKESDIYELVPFIDKRVLIVAPRAPGIAQETARGSYTWYDRGEPGKVLKGLFEHSLAQLEILIGELPGLCGVGVDPTQIYAGGFSQGAGMSLALAANYPLLLAGVLSHSGFGSSEVIDQLRNGAFRGKSAWVGHGTQDSVLSAELGRKAVEALQAGGVSVTHREYPIGHETSVQSRRDLAEWLNTRLQF